jgi:hypothetical protein
MKVGDGGAISVRVEAVSASFLHVAAEAETEHGKSTFCRLSFSAEISMIAYCCPD